MKQRFWRILTVLFFFLMASAFVFLCFSAVSKQQINQELSDSIFAITEAQRIKTHDAMQGASHTEIPLLFIANQGQINNDSVKFVSSSDGASFYFLPQQVVLSLVHQVIDKNETKTALLSGEKNSVKRVQGTNIFLNFENANPDVEIVGQEQGTASINYFSGNDSSQWQTNVANYNSILYKNLYSGIDLLYRGGSVGELKSEFYLEPGAKADAIIIRVDGVEKLSVDPEGNLVFETEYGNLTEKKPFSYQTVNGDKKETPVSYKLLDSHTYSFEANEYNKDFLLVIDPGLMYSTYLGGTSFDYVYGLATGSDGNVFATGETYSSSGFPSSSGSYDTSYNGTSGTTRNMFVVKLSPRRNGANDLKYATFIGGVSTGRKIVLAPDGNVFVVGDANGSFPTTAGAFDTDSNGATDIVIVKLSPLGNGSSDLLYSTFLGGTSDDTGSAIALGSDGNVYVAGYVSAGGFPVTSNAYETTYSATYSGVIVKLSPLGNGGSDLKYSTYFNGSGNVLLYSVGVGSDGNIYVGGVGSGGTPTTVGAYDRTDPTQDGVIAKISPSGNGNSDLLYSTVLGGTGSEALGSIAIDSGGAVYATGSTPGSDFPTTIGAYDRDLNGSSDIYVVKLSPLGNGSNDLLYSTYVGGTATDNANNLVVDSSGNVLVVGDTQSSDFPTSADANDSTYNGGDPVLFKLSPLGNGSSDLRYSTLLGIGSSDDYGYAVAIGYDGNVYVGGVVKSGFGATTGAYDTSQSGFNDGFIAALALNSAPTISITKIDSYSDNSSLPAFSYAHDRNITVDFNVLDDASALTIDVNYSSSNTQGTGTPIVTNLNLATLGTSGAYNCDDTVFTNSTRCSVDWNTVGISDGNYFILVSVGDGSLSDFNASDNNFMMDNTKASTSWSGADGVWQTSNVSITLSCTDANSGCATTQYRLDSDATTNISYGGWTTYSGAISITTDGNFAVDFNSMDNAGNRGDENIHYVLIDQNKASTSWSGATDSVWSTSNLSITLACSDATSGCATTKYRLDSDSSATVSYGAWTTYVEAISITSDGNYAIDFNSTDVAGNVGDENVHYALLDKTGPSTSWNGDHNTWRSSVSITLTCSDANSGCSTTQYRVDSNAQNGVSYGAWTTYSGAISFPTDGNWGLDFNSTDIAGNRETTQTFLVLVDAQLPSTTSDINNNSWQNHDANITLSCTSSFSPCTTTQYRVDADSNSSVTMAAWQSGSSFGISSDGNWVVDYNSTNLAGNRETTNRKVVLIERNNPGVSWNGDHNVWKSSAQEVTLTCTDSNSGCSTTRYRLDTDPTNTVSWGASTTYSTPISFSNDGNYRIDFNATDSAGNTSDLNTFTVLIDRTTPTTTTNAPSGWSNENVSVTLSCSDGNSSAKRSECSTTRYSIDNSTALTYSSAISFSSDGNYRLDYNSSDIAGNTETTKSVWVAVDKTVPSVVINNPGAITSTGFSLTYSGSDATAGIQKYWVSNDLVNWVDNNQNTSYAFSIDSGTRLPYVTTYYVIATDNADNNSSATSITVTFESASSGTVEGNYCENEICSENESAVTCPQDCPAVCGDRACTHTENPESCAVDCASGCGNLVCESPLENPENCPRDCEQQGAPRDADIPETACGNSVCELTENTQNCSLDCQESIVVSEEEITKNQRVKVEDIPLIAHELGKSDYVVEPKLLETGAKFVFDIKQEVITQTVQVGGEQSERTKITNHISNKTNASMTTSFVVIVPKEVAEHATQIASEVPFSVVNDDPVIEFSFVLRPGEIFPLTYYVNKKITEAEAQKLRPAIATRFEVETSDAFIEEGCVDDGQCNLGQACVAFKCLNRHCFYGSQPDNTYCGVGGQVCQDGKCVSRDYPVYTPPITTDLTNVLLIAILVVLSLLTIREYQKPIQPPNSKNQLKRDPSGS